MGDYLGVLAYSLLISGIITRGDRLIPFFLTPFHPTWYLYKPLAAPKTRMIRLEIPRSFCLSSSSLRVPSSQYSMTIEN